METLNIYNDYQEPYIFISYSHNDTDAVLRVLDIMQKNRYRFWFDEGIPSGSEWADELVRRIHNCSVVLVFLSKEAVKSKNVKNELMLAYKRNKPIHVVLLEEVELEGGFEYILAGQQQCVKVEAFSEHEVETRLCKVLGSETRCVERVSNASVLGKDSPSNNVFGGNDFESRYEMIQMLGRGVLGETFLARQRSTDMIVVVKRTIKEGISKNAEIFKGIDMECRVLANTRCPYIPVLIDSFEDDTYKYLVENQVPGKDLETYCGENRLREEECVDIVIKVAKILQRLSDGKEEFVHRDIKPANIMIDEYGDVYLIDFSGGKYMPRGQRVPDSISIGTPGFAAREQMGSFYKGVFGYNQPICTDVRTDIYALGKVLYYLLMSPYEKKEKIVQRIKDDYIMTIRYFNPDYHPKLDVIISRMTGDLPEQRYSNLGEVIDALLSYKNISLQQKHRLIRDTDAEIQAAKMHEGISPNEKSGRSGLNIPELVRFSSTEISSIYKSELLGNEDDFRTVITGFAD